MLAGVSQSLRVGQGSPASPVSDSPLESVTAQGPTHALRTRHTSPAKPKLGPRPQRPILRLPPSPPSPCDTTGHSSQVGFLRPPVGSPSLRQYRPQAQPSPAQPIPRTAHTQHNPCLPCLPCLPSLPRYQGPSLPLSSWAAKAGCISTHAVFATLPPITRPEESSRDT